ncbi:uncharacterized protein SPPG_06706 [Spizellomyces punctatus DAOM BR117]|uniref:Histone deacetylase complex subunit SAP18 n=1 Tax=Spizellomyces punctatus (strain DAOM BR117) TaxID=645134 RepID=A0A0L0HC17_SPIPD|nr:uncharacterized protein SPPG_06706 [Spizellomyces punctatus DAOM BR117]KNC98313.1 hypothetical protein SPPG_06706 [Spizellomyces punctatus DAOM BR117]|eukprot:XP_016606353.1 hypothetical protein SPPG_06706 [Spizellomyces punctatus DAOM BR117]
MTTEASKPTEEMEKQSEADATEEHRHKELERGEEREEQSQETKESRGRKKLTVDREKTCPFLVRMYVSTKGDLRVEDLERDGLPERDEHLVYTWKDATLRELASLLQTTYPAAKPREVRISFRAISRVSTRPLQFRCIPLGNVFNFRSSYDDTKTLSDLRFVVGDAVLVSIAPTEPGHPERRESGSAVPFRRPSGRDEGFGGFRGDRFSSDRDQRRFDPYRRPKSSFEGRRSGTESRDLPRYEERGFDRRRSSAR